jgi:hypothetical protein
MNHALRVIFLSNISRQNFTSEVFNLGQKKSKSLDLLLPGFIDTALKPVMSQLMTDLDSIRFLHHVSDDPYIKMANQYLIVGEASRIRDSLAECVSVLGTVKVSTLDEALQLYFRIEKMRSTVSLKALRLEAKRDTSLNTRIPFQVRLHRAFSKIVHKLAKSSDLKE